MPKKGLVTKKATYKAVGHALCTVTIEAIKFNHDINSLSHDAINLRQSGSIHVNLPEWIKGRKNVEDSPAAYAMSETNNNQIKIMAKFTVIPKTIDSVEVKADGGGVLGRIEQKKVNFLKGVSNPEFVYLPLNNHEINKKGVLREDIKWDWKYRCPKDQVWKDIQSTNHRIYVVRGKPKSPWKQTPFPDTQNPWVEVLDYACEWAKGALDFVEVAKKITEKVHAQKKDGGLGLRYDTKKGKSKYTNVKGSKGPSFFECTYFLKYLKEKAVPSKKFPDEVNCTDCATIVTTFSNIIGCNLKASIMMDKNDSDDFKLNSFVPIGKTDFTNCAFPDSHFPNSNPNSNHVCSFSYHEVACTCEVPGKTKIFDACLKVATNEYPWNNPQDPLVPANMPFTELDSEPPVPIPTPFKQMSYRERLCTNDKKGIHICQEQGPWDNTNDGRREVT